MKKCQNNKENFFHFVRHGNSKKLKTDVVSCKRYTDFPRIQVSTSSFLPSSKTVLKTRHNGVRNIQAPYEVYQF